MNAATAKHLTHLHQRSQPIVWDGELRWGHLSLSYEYIVGVIKPIERQHAEAAQAEEIRLAAREHREAASYYCGISHAAATAASWHPYGGFGRLLLAMCLDQIHAAIAADNARRLAEYEAYRVACECGVAVPPPEGKS